MNELLETAIVELYSKLTYLPKKILEIFNDFFGEDRVDMQGFIDLQTFEKIIKETPFCNYMQNWNHICSIDNYTNSINSLSSGKDKDNLITFIININKHILIDDQKISIKGSPEENYFITKMADFIGTEGFILVHFPTVKVTNEFDKYVYINHLYAKIFISPFGYINKGTFFLNRSEYPVDHMLSNYMHSHVNSIPVNDFSYFERPCLGSGPIVSTIASLSSYSDLDLWKLFCLELQKYVETESIEGIPYHRLEEIGGNNYRRENSFHIVLSINRGAISAKFMTEGLKDFTEYFINQKKLKFSYINGNYSLGMSCNEYMVLISNIFIEWYNKEYNINEYNYSFEDLIETEVLKEGKIINNKLCYFDDNIERKVNRVLLYRDKYVCTFKGEDVKIKITDSDAFRRENMTTFLNSNIALYILYKILITINYGFKGISRGKKQLSETNDKFNSQIEYF